MAQSITSVAMLERLMDMAVGVENASSALLQALSAPNVTAEYIDKAFRHDLLRFKELVAKGEESLLDFMANGRLSVIPYKQFYVDLALQLDCVMSRLEAGAYRLLMLYSIDSSPAQEIMDDARELLRQVGAEASLLADVLRASETPPKDPTMRRKLLDDKYAQGTDSEARADSVYREALARILVKYRDNPSEMMIFKEVIDSFEDAVDCAYRALTYGRIIGIGSLS